MIQTQDPRWLKFVSKYLSWIALPGISLIFVTVQVLGFFLVMTDAVWMERLALIPGLALHGEPWRVITFLALPMTMSPIWIIFSLFFLYSILNSIEAEWGAFKTTFYVLVSIVLTILFSLVTGHPVIQVSDFVSSLFLAAAALFPNQEIRVYLAFPVKMKFLGWLTLGFVVFRLFQGSGMERLFLLTIYSNYLLFFGPSLVAAIRQWKRQRDYRKNFK